MVAWTLLVSNSRVVSQKAEQESTKSNLLVCGRLTRTSGQKQGTTAHVFKRVEYKLISTGQNTQNAHPVCPWQVSGT